ncbi:hypothetical protein CF165_49045 [Amycolatopsis vastitatis]|uniref:Uncharacterized protein n=1 Tax=Amycolatopsis vastitatis TaxID=1905142 RepID=A0A229SJV9_9PSEU|nr:hypothetical protein CF165_49045 [Amycolatopsis vastitatis]
MTPSATTQSSSPASTASAGATLSDLIVVDEPTTGDLTYLEHRHAQQHHPQLNLPETTSIQALALS